MKATPSDRSTSHLGVVLGLALALVACTTSEDGPLDDSGTAGVTGGAGSSASGAAGTTGSAGSSSSGAAGSSVTGAAGTSVNGAAGTGATGKAGTTGTTGAAGTTGKAGTTGSTGAAGTTGLAGTSGAAGTGSPEYTFTTGIGNMLDLACGGCHLENTSVPIKGNFGTSWEKVMASVTSDHMNCPNLDATKKRIVPGKPENSMIYIKVATANLPGSCGGHMPANGVNMGASQIQALKDWILRGAKQ